MNDKQRFDMYKKQLQYFVDHLNKSYKVSNVKYVRMRPEMINGKKVHFVAARGLYHITYPKTSHRFQMIAIGKEDESAYIVNSYAFTTKEEAIKKVGEFL